jgi:hypothetical protein
MTDWNFHLNQIVWVWVRNQQPDPGIIVQLASDGELESESARNASENLLASHEPMVVLVNGKLYAINRHRLWHTEFEAITVGPPFFLPGDIDERNY